MLPSPSRSRPPLIQLSTTRPTMRAKTMTGYSARPGSGQGDHVAVGDVADLMDRAPPTTCSRSICWSRPVLTATRALPPAHARGGRRSFPARRTRPPSGMPIPAFFGMATHGVEQRSARIPCASRSITFAPVVISAIHFEMASEMSGTAHAENGCEDDQLADAHAALGRPLVDARGYG